MDRRERYESMQDALMAMMVGWQREMWTAMPGKVISFDATKMTCQIQIPIQIMFKIGDADPSPLNIPPLLDVPVFFPSGGGYNLTFPVAAGDEALVVFASRCIDTWWQNGSDAFAVPPFYRMHDLSDGFAFVGFRSLVRMLSGIATDAVQLRSDDKNNLLEIKNGGIINIKSTVSVNINTGAANISTTGSTVVNAGGAASVIAGGNASVSAGGNANINGTTAVNVTAPAINLTGAVTIAGALAMTGGANADFGASTISTTGDLSISGKSLKNHIHSGVASGTSNTGPIV